jgi:hypothetical protein
MLDCYNNQAIMREWSTFYMIIEPECESGAHYIRESSQNARVEHMCYDNLASMQEWSTF